MYHCPRLRLATWSGIPKFLQNFLPYWHDSIFCVCCHPGVIVEFVEFGVGSRMCFRIQELEEGKLRKKCFGKGSSIESF